MPTSGDDSAENMQAEVLKYRLERQNAAQSYNAEMSKWILASLIVVNGAPFLLASKDLPDLTGALAKDAWFFTFAIALAIVCGFCAWLNTGMREASLDYQVRRSMPEAGFPEAAATISRGERWTLAIVKAAYVGAILTGFASLAMFLIGSWHLSVDYRGEKPATAAAAETSRLTHAR